MSRAVLRQFAVLFAVSGLGLGGLVWWGERTRQTADRAIVEAGERSHVSQAHRAVTDAVDGVTADVRYLSGCTALARFLRTGDEEARQELEIELARLSEAKGYYDQVRFIDEAGREVVRVDLKGSRAVAIPREELQDKSGRYYFTDAFALGRGEIFVSPLDLNIERGEIERPLKPMLRVGTPTFDSSGRKRGIVLVNYLARVLLRAVADAMADAVGRPMVLNRDGYWLLADDPSLEWGFMFGNDQRFSARHGEAWQRIRNSRAGQFETEGDLFTFVTVHPLLRAQVSSTGSILPVGASLSPLDAQEYFWKFVSFAGRDVFAARARAQLWQTLGVYAALMGAAGFGCWILARARVRNRQAEEELRLSAAVMDSTAEGALVTDARGHIVRVNHAFGAISGWTPADVLGREARELWWLSENEQEEEPWRDLVVRGEWRGEVWSRRRSGEAYPAWLTLSAVCDLEGRVAHYVGMFSDISDRVAAERELKRLAHHDALTGLPNRALFYDRLGSALKRARRYQTHLAVLNLDLDRFKSINDELGHEAGDAVLVETGRRLESCLRETDTAARLGGDEFAVVLTDLTDPASAAIVAQKIVVALTQPVMLGPRLRSVGVSVGISVFPNDGDETDALLRRADEAMYEVKKTGQVGWRFAGDQTAAREAC